MKLRIGRLTFVISYPLLCVMTAVIILDSSYSVLLCFSAAVMHELGHLAALAAYHSAPETIKLALFDIAIIDNKKALRKVSHELVVTLAGVAVNFISAMLLLIVQMFCSSNELAVLTAAHLTLGGFNSLPIYSLDGGQALCLILSRHFPPRKANNILTVISLIILFPLALCGFLLLLQTRYNFTLLLVSLWLIFETLK